MNRLRIAARKSPAFRDRTEGWVLAFKPPSFFDIHAVAPGSAHAPGGHPPLRPVSTPPSVASPQIQSVGDCNTTTTIMPDKAL